MSRAAHPVCATILAVAMVLATSKDSAGLFLAVLDNLSADVRTAQQLVWSAADNGAMDIFENGDNICLPSSADCRDMVAVKWAFFYMWAWTSAVSGMWLLVADRHFRLAVCASLSANYWCAATSLASTVSPTIGVALGLTAIVTRRSMLLFPDSRTPSASRVI